MVRTVYGQGRPKNMYFGVTWLFQGHRILSLFAFKYSTNVGETGSSINIVFFLLSRISLGGTGLNNRTASRQVGLPAELAELR